MAIQVLGNIINKLNPRPSSGGLVRITGWHHFDLGKSLIKISAKDIVGCWHGDKEDKARNKKGNYAR
jgi:hypothetical protein